MTTEPDSEPRPDVLAQVTERARSNASSVKDALIITFDVDDEVLLHTSQPQLFDLIVMQRLLADYVDRCIGESGP